MRARGIAISADGQRGYVGLTDDTNRGVIGILALQPLTMTRQAGLGPNSSSLNDVALRHDERLLFAAEREAGALAVVDLLSATLTHRLPVGALPNGVALQRGVGYVANFGSHSVTIFNPATGAISGTINNIGAEPSLFAVEEFLPNAELAESGCCIASDQVFLSLHGADQVITLAGIAPIDARTAMTDAYGLAYDPAGRRLYVAHRGPAHRISVIDVAADHLLGAIDTAEKEPYVLAVNPETGHLFAVCDGQVRVYRTSDWGLVKIIALAAGDNSRISLDRVFGRVYITAFEERMLSVIQD